MTFWGLYLFDVLLDVEFVGLFVVGAGVLDVHTRPHQFPVALSHGGVGGSDGLVSFHCQNRPVSRAALAGERTGEPG